MPFETTRLIKVQLFIVASSPATFRQSAGALISFQQFEEAADEI